MKEYATEVVKILDPNKEFVAGVLAKEDCIEHRGWAIKDIRIFRQFTEESAIIVDNKAASFALNVENGICIRSYFGGAEDKELQKVQEFLLKICNVKDVRPYVIQFAGVFSLYEKYLEEAVASF